MPNEEIGYFFCGNCGGVDSVSWDKNVPYEKKPQKKCLNCGFDDEWIYEPTGEKDADTV